MSSSETVKILYMEDDAGVARLFQRKLQGIGYTVDLAPDGEQGLLMFAKSLYDMVVIDQRLPVYDGLDVLKEMAKRGALPPTIMLAGAGNERIAVEALKLGAGDYIVKDIEGGYLELLPAVIDQLLAKQRLVAERQQALESLEQRNRNLALLNEIAQSLTSTLRVEEVIEQFLPAVAYLTGFPCNSLWLRSVEQPDRFECQAIFCNETYQTNTKRSLRPGEGLIGQAAKLQHSTVTRLESTQNGMHPAEHLYTHSSPMVVLTIPLSVRENVIGILQAATNDQVFDDQALVLAETLAASAAVAINNAQLVETLTKQTQEMQARNEELDAFSHTVAHDLKNPLSVTLGYSQYLKRRYASSLDEKAIHSLTEIEQYTIKMRNIIDELLLLASIRNAEADVENLDMEQIVKEACKRIEPMVEQFQARVEMQQHWPPALGFAAWVEEIWMNYLTNALKYGGRPPHIQLGSTNLNNGMIQFWIKDNGVGLTKAQQKQLFTPFTRLKQVRAEGNGLGLSIVRRIVEKLGGEASVESEVGSGSKFSFTLPAA